MSSTSRRNSVLCVMLAAVFYWGFMFAKHSRALGDVIPFGVDPYDAVGSFAIFVALLVAVIAVVRAFRRYPAPLTAVQRLHLVRAQMAVVLVVLITVGTDALAMARHPGMWMHSPALATLIALLAGLGLVALAVERLVAGPDCEQRSVRPRWPTVGAAIAVAAAALGFYPERLIVGVWTHLLTVVVAAVILFATTRVLLIAIVPDLPDDASLETSTNRVFGRAARWGIVTLIGAAFGASAFLGELSEGSSPNPIARVLAVAAVFLGLAIAGIAVAFAFLGAPLGLAPRRRA